MATDNRLFEDANLPLARELAAFYTGFVKFNTPAFFPNVDVYAEKGSGFETLVGLRLQDLSVGQPVTATTGIFTRPDGDLNQEDITNDSIVVWRDMPCFRFELADNEPRQWRRRARFLSRMPAMISTKASSRTREK